MRRDTANNRPELTSVTKDKRPFERFDKWENECRFMADSRLSWMSRPVSIEEGLHDPISQFHIARPAHLTLHDGCVVWSDWVVFSEITLVVAINSALVPQRTGPRGKGGNGIVNVLGQ